MDTPQLRFATCGHVVVAAVAPALCNVFMGRPEKNGKKEKGKKGEGGGGAGLGEVMENPTKNEQSALFMYLQQQQQQQQNARQESHSLLLLLLLVAVVAPRCAVFICIVSTRYTHKRMLIYIHNVLGLNSTVQAQLQQHFSHLKESAPATTTTASTR